ncbi:MAG: SusC/RagA family TonB-linked outer membrane protein [Spirosomataceae bacterium]
MKKKLLFSLGLMLALIVQVWAQDRSVTGKVTSGEDSSPLPGVSVAIKGSTKGAQTDANGVYKISVPNNAVLLFSYIGFETQQVTVGAKSVIDVSLKPDAKTLQEVTITAGYGQYEKKSFTGARGELKSKGIENRPFSSAVGALQGQVAGLQTVATTGQPGAFQQVRIRGIGSINASAEPLYVIDGIVVNAGDFSNRTTSSSTLAGLNPNDIEEMVVLKDAASTSIYGSRGANGVILITTKKGKAGKTQFSANAEYGTNNLSIPNLAKPLNRSEYLSLTEEGLKNAGASAATITNTLNALGASNTDDVDWLSAVTRTGQYQNYSLQAQGGDNKTTFFMSGGYYKEQATVIGSQFDRISGNANIRHNASEKLSFSLNVNVSGSNQLTPNNGGAFANPVLSAYFLRPTQRIYNPDGSFDVSTTTFANIYNPVALVAVNKNKYFSLKGLAGMGAEYRPIKNLTLSTKYGIDFNAIEENYYRNPQFGDGRNTGGGAFADYTRFFNWTWTNQADYRIYLNEAKDFTADVKVGYEAQLSKTYFSNVYSEGFPSSTDLIYPVVASTPKTASASGSDYSFASAYSNVAFNYKNKYSLTGSARQDKSSRFGINNRTGNFWSVGAAWNIDQEAFLQNNSVVSALKLRASYGVNGNGGIGNYAWRATYGYGFNYNQVPGSAPNNIGNADLTWELSKPFNVGIDAGLLKDRINVSFDYYNRQTSNLLLDVPLSRTSGFSSQTANIGAMENKGFELTINASPVKAKDFSWDINFNIAVNKNKITALFQNQDILSGSFIRRVGLDYQTFYLREWAGVDPQTGNPLWYLNTQNTDGTFDRTTTTNYNAAQRIVTSGSATPKSFGGLTNTLRYKGLSLEFQFYFNFGNKVQDTWAAYLIGDGFNPSFNKYKKQLQRWQNPGDITDVPKYIYNNSNLSYSASTRYLYDGGFIRLRNVVVRYELPKTVLKTLKLNTMSVYARGTNLWTKTMDENLYFDPEVGIAGQTNLNIFLSKTLSFGLNIGF